MAMRKVVKKALKKVEFQLKAPENNWVGVAGNFNEWDPTKLVAKRNKAGLWRVSFKIAPGSYEYKFVVDGSWITDPAAKKRIANNFGTENSVLVVK